MGRESYSFLLEDRVLLDQPSRHNCLSINDDQDFCQRWQINDIRSSMNSFHITTTSVGSLIPGTIRFVNLFSDQLLLLVDATYC